MPFFGGSKRDSDEIAVPEHSPEPVTNTTAPAPGPSAPAKKRGIFHRRRQSSGSLSSASIGSGSEHLSHGRTSAAGNNYDTATINSSEGGLSRNGTRITRSFGNGTNRHDGIDPSISAARERIISAENAEREADRAMEQARLRVREAREHMRRLEEEAREEARRAQIKQQQAREVTKRGKGLGRHGG